MNPLLYYIENTLRASTKKYVEALSKKNPQVIIIEGGTAKERIYVSLYIIAGVQCQSKNAPCLSCSSCNSIISKYIASEEYNEIEKDNKKNHGIYFRFGDLHYFDARYGLYNNQIRLLKEEISSTPKNKHSICIAELQEAHSIKELSNALLKILEEPKDSLFFVITTPIRSQLLPTIASRAHSITLAWPSSNTLECKEIELLESMEIFLATGKGYFSQEKINKKSFQSEELGIILTYFQTALCQALKAEPINTLSKIFYTYPKDTLYLCSEITAIYQEQCKANVSPSLIADTFILSIYKNLMDS